MKKKLKRRFHFGGEFYDTAYFADEFDYEELFEEATSPLKDFMNHTIRDFKEDTDVNRITTVIETNKNHMLEVTISALDISNYILTERFVEFE